MQAPLKPVEIYLNDHLAGARGALDLIDAIIEGSTDEEFVAFFQRLRAEVDEDREQLVEVMELLGVSEQRVKQVLATFAETASRLKLTRVGQPEALSQLFELETLSAGIWMKTRLWRSLRATLSPRLEQVDLDALVQRGERQLEELDTYRLKAAREALTG